jgi:hypothetical protein
VLISHVTAKARRANGGLTWRDPRARTHMTCAPDTSLEGASTGGIIDVLHAGYARWVTVVPSGDTDDLASGLSSRQAHVTRAIRVKSR